MNAARPEHAQLMTRTHFSTQDAKFLIFLYQKN